MSLNIKSEAVYTMARELADATDMSMTSAVEDALRRRLEDVHVRSRRTQARTVLEEIWKTMSADDRAAIRRIESDMYDEAGMPR